MLVFVRFCVLPFWRNEERRRWWWLNQYIVMLHDAGIKALVCARKLCLRHDDYCCLHISMKVTEAKFHVPYAHNRFSATV